MILILGYPVKGYSSVLCSIVLMINEDNILNSLLVTNIILPKGLSNYRIFGYFHEN